MAETFRSAKRAGTAPEDQGPAVPPAAEKDEKKVASAGDLLLSLGVIGLGIFFFVGAFNIEVSPSYAHIGPRFFPFLVAGGLLTCGALLLIQTLRGRVSVPSEGEDVDPGARTNWGAIVVIGSTLLSQVLLIERIGFIPTSALLFVGIALGFGSRRYVRNAITGLSLSSVVYLAFTRLLDLNLPGGILTSILGSVTGSRL